MSRTVPRAPWRAYRLAPLSLLAFILLFFGVAKANAAELFSPYAVSGQTSNHNLFTIEKIGAETSFLTTTQGVYPGTSPSTTEWYDGTETAFASYGSSLLMTHRKSTVLNTEYNSNTGLGISPGTSPAVAANHTIAFRAAGNNHLWINDAASGTEGETPLGIAPNSSPSIATSGPEDKGWTVAFRAANSNHLWLYNSNGVGFDTGLGVAESSSPSITAVQGGYVVAFRAAGSGTLWTYTTATGVGQNTGLGIEWGSNPSIAHTGGTGWIAAFQGAATQHLWTFNSAGTGHDTGIKTRLFTSPGIVQLSNENGMAYQSPAGELWTYSSQGSSEDLGFRMAENSSPSISWEP